MNTHVSSWPHSLKGGTPIMLFRRMFLETLMTGIKKAQPIFLFLKYIVVHVCVCMCTCVSVCPGLWLFLMVTSFQVVVLFNTWAWFLYKNQYFLRTDRSPSPTEYWGFSWDRQVWSFPMRYCVSAIIAVHFAKADKWFHLSLCPPWARLEFCHCTKSVCLLFCYWWY